HLQFHRTNRIQIRQTHAPAGRRPDQKRPDDVYQDLMKKLLKALKFVLSKFGILFIIVFRFLARCVRAINRKKRYAIPFYSFLAYVLLVILLIKFLGDSTYKKVIPNKRVNDVTKLNPIQVGKE